MEERSLIVLLLVAVAVSATDPDYSCPQNYLSSTQEAMIVLNQDLSLTQWGYNHWVEAHDETPVVPPPVGVQFKKVGRGRSLGACAITLQNEIRCWGHNWFSLIDDVPSGNNWKAVAPSRNSHCALDFAGEITCWGRHSDPALSQSHGIVIPTGPFTDIVSSLLATCAIKESDKSIVCFGHPTQSRVLSPPSGSFDHIDCGTYSCCAITTSGTISCWGDINSNDPYNLVANSPSIPTGTNFKMASISGRAGFGCGLTHHGSLDCWGDTADYDIPVEDGFLALACTFNDCCVLDASGGTECFGNDGVGGQERFKVITERPLSGVKTDQCECGYPYILNNENGLCYMSDNTPRTQAQAKTFCESHGGRLPVVHSEAENSWIVSELTSGNGGVWLGLDQLASANFEWVNDEFNTFAKWMYTFGAPEGVNNDVSKRCAVITTSVEDFEWMDMSCINADPSFHTVCQAEPAERHWRQCPFGFSLEPTSGNCYMFKDQNMDWETARNFCLSKGADLPIILNPENNDFVRTIAGGEDAWLGLHDLSTENEFLWVDGMPLQGRWDNWETGMPNDHHVVFEEDCGVLVGDLHLNRATWDDRDCRQAAAAKVVCQWLKPDEQPTPAPTYPPTSACPPGWILNPHDQDCYLWDSTLRTRPAAQQHCQSQGGDLVVIRSMTTNTWIRNTLATSNEPLWIGLMWDSDDNAWEWNFEDPNPLNIATFWMHPNPTGGSGGLDFTNKCVFMTGGYQAGMWANRDCNDANYAETVCQLSKKCPHGFEYNSENGNCYLYHNEPLDFDDARAFCQTFGADIPTVRNADENAYIVGRTPMDNGAVWIGLSDRETMGTWKWLDGTATSATVMQWASHEPSSIPNERCAIIGHRSRSYDWTQKDCTRTDVNVVCEYRNLCRDGFQLDQDSGECYHYDATGRSYNDAKNYCATINAQLPFIQNAHDNEFAFSHAHSNLVWIGYHDRAVEGIFEWERASEPNTYTNWKPNNPSIGVNVEDCAAFGIRNPLDPDEKKWSDMDCTSPLPHTLCQYNLRPNARDCRTVQIMLVVRANVAFDCQSLSNQIAYGQVQSAHVNPNGPCSNALANCISDGTRRNLNAEDDIFSATYTVQVQYTVQDEKEENYLLEAINDPNYTQMLEGIDGVLKVESVALELAVLDIDGDGEIQPLTDGIMFVRHLFGGFGEEELTAEATDPDASRTSQEILSHLSTMACDIDGDGTCSSLTDGTLLMRYLFGNFKGQELVDGAVGTNAQRTTPEQIEEYLELLMRRGL